MANVTHTQTTYEAAADRISSRVADLRQRFAQWRFYQRTISELSALDNRDLDDLGISRGEIRDIAWHSVYGR